MSGQIKYCNKVWTANGCTHAHDDVAGQELGTTNSGGVKRTVPCMFATPEPTTSGGGGGGGGPVSPPRVQRVLEMPGAPKKVTYAQKARPNPEMPGWMIEGEELESKYPEIAEAKAAYKRTVENASATEKAAISAGNEAYKAEREKAAELEKAKREKAGGGGKKKPHKPVDLTHELKTHELKKPWGDVAMDSGEEDSEQE